MMFILNGWDLFIIVALLVMVVGVGLWGAHRQQKTARDYFLASGRMPWWIIGSAFVSTSVSSEQIIGTIGAAYVGGMGVANWEWWSLPPYLILIFVFIPIYLKNRIATVPEILRRRYGRLCGDIYGWCMLVAYVVVFLVPVLYGGSLAAAELTGWNFHLVLWATVALVAIYTVKGGLVSVMWTDALQCLLLIGGGLVLYFIALRHIPGGWSAMVEANPDRFHLYHPPSDPGAPFLGMVLGTFTVFTFYQATNQVMVQRVLGARSLWDGIVGVIFAGFINLIRPMVTCFLGFIVYHWIHEMHKAPPLDNSDKTFTFALQSFAPDWGLRGIILTGFLAAVMSSVSALANSTATLFALDFYKRLIRRDADDRQLIRVGRYASFASLALAGLLAPLVPYFGGIFKYFQTGVTFLATPFITVIMVGLFWKRANQASALFGMIGGFVIQLLIVMLDFPLIGHDLHWLYTASIAQVLILLGMVGVAVCTPAPPPAQWEPFLWRPSLLGSLLKLEKIPGHRNPYLWLALFATIWILIYIWFW